MTRRLAQINVSPGANLQSYVNDATSGDVLILANGTYTGSFSSVLSINKNITIRALNPGRAILDGENIRPLVYVSDATVNLQGLCITRGFVSVAPKSFAQHNDPV